MLPMFGWFSQASTLTSRSKRASRSGSDVNASRICRYALRPPVAQERLQWTDDGQVRLELRRSWADGTTHLLFNPVELLERLAALTPRPRINLIFYHGILAPRAAWRSLVVQFGTAVSLPTAAQSEAVAEAAADAADRPHGGISLWAELMRRSLAWAWTSSPVPSVAGASG